MKSTAEKAKQEFRAHRRIKFMSRWLKIVLLAAVPAILIYHFTWGPGEGQFYTYLFPQYK